MDAYVKMLDNLAEFSDLVSALKSNKTPIQLSGVSDSVRAHLIYSVCRKLNAPALAVVPEVAAAKDLCEDLKFFFGEDVFFFPEKDLLFYDVEASGQDVVQERLRVLRHLTEKPEMCCVVTTLGALTSVTVPVSVYREKAFQLSEGDEADLQELAVRLTELGYHREDMVEGPGQFSVRGGILDVYPCDGEIDGAIRIEFFDTEVDSIRLFDPESQRTVERLNRAEIYPVRELLLSDLQRTKLIDTLQAVCRTVNPSEERTEKVLSVLHRDIERLEQGMLFPSLDKYIPYIYSAFPTLLDYLVPDTIVFFDEPVHLSEKAGLLSNQQAEEICDLAQRGVLAQPDMEYSIAWHKAVSRLLAYRVVGMSGVSQRTPDYRPAQIQSLTVKSLQGFQGKLSFLCEALRYYQQNIYQTVILAGSEGKAKNLIRQIEEEGIHCNYQETLEVLPNPGGITVTCGSLKRGFEYPLIRVAVLGDREIFGGMKKKRRRVKPKNSEKIANFMDLSPGDYVVHQNHGIGQYTGIEQLCVEGVRKDYLKIQYRGSDVLYVPADQLDMVFKYTVKDTAHVRVNKLGGTEWGKTRQRVKAAAAEMAERLLALYAQRSKLKGISFLPDTEWQHDFEAAFPYEETEDQLRSIAEVKADMEKPHPMDRLLCGDVGYGKTEVAMRAAFKAVMSGYQVAYLVPTTILASQHYHNFKQRMMDYPIQVGMLSRFATGAYQKEVLKGLASGEIDVVIGTHKLLGKAVKFRKLGLLVIDEEQRFGVGHKEKLKELRREVDVLTLSATPIPRTLYMSLSGIRDMSVINQPPGDRLPVATYVLEYDENVIREAILRELARNGQVYYLFNRVEGIYRAANKIAEMAPEARVAVAHGQMHERELEEIMMDVANGEVDILVCTTIIETGLDIANVNTLIIENADRLGLAQLYQLRGRVGRSNRLAYAYLTFRRNKVLTPEAEKRLLAIKEFTEFGSGFKIAMRDLEIRGTGNLIGPQQHGHMEAVGYEMYCQLLEEAVREQRGEIEEVKTETLIDLPVSAYIPEQYIQNHSQRIQAYKRISSIETQEELYDAYDEIEDRYGTVPQVVANLMESALLRAMAQRCGVTEMIGNLTQVIFKFDEKHMPDPAAMVKLVTLRSQSIFLPNPDKPRLHFKLEKPEPGKEKEYFAAIAEILGHLSGEKPLFVNGV
ncbi:transcription-repair coupling factor [Ructibacterium gallinarum]|uniref:Transcription-repair-coupling factor n=1 Tax=Ructibacterium gallinarum TaxID=2779355 RepID=A0A9D5LYN8_9FIRM|nr:transcription-repair coupling factor [Ructibacterium gallinarum]MBE5040443.1 transcription-repair coupling factor [Ructibacterium gallinarum]